MGELNLDKVKNYLLIIVLASVVLYFGRTIFIPLSFALFISFLLYPICKWLEKHRVPKSFAVVICLILLIVVGLLVCALLFQQISAFAQDFNSLKEKIPSGFMELNKFLTENLGITTEFQTKWIGYFSRNSSSEFFSLFNKILYSSGLLVVWLILIPLFSALILLNRSTLVLVLFGFFKEEYIIVVQKILHQTVTSYYNFIKGMLLVYLIVGILNSLGLMLLGIPHPLLFGFIASILTFVPFVGIIVGSLLPIAVSWLTYNSILYPIGVIIIFTIVQYLEAYLIFPLAVSNRMKINSLTTIISIFVGGILWGAAGMILFVPFIAIIKLIADNTPSLQNLSLLLGEK